MCEDSPFTIGTPEESRKDKSTKVVTDGVLIRAAYLCELPPPPWLSPPVLYPRQCPIVDARASDGVAATSSNIVITGGVTAANLPHLFKNSRRAAWPSGSMGIAVLSLKFSSQPSS